MPLFFGGALHAESPDTKGCAKARFVAIVKTSLEASPTHFKTLKVSMNRKNSSTSAMHSGDRARMILVMRFMHEMSLEQVSTALGITRDRVRQIEAKTITSIRSRKDFRSRALSALGVNGWANSTV